MAIFLPILTNNLGSDNTRNDDDKLTQTKYLRLYVYKYKRIFALQIQDHIVICPPAVAANLLCRLLLTLSVLIS